MPAEIDWRVGAEPRIAAGQGAADRSLREMDIGKPPVLDRQKVRQVHVAHPQETKRPQFRHQARKPVGLGNPPRKSNGFAPSGEGGGGGVSANKLLW